MTASGYLSVLGRVADQGLRAMAFTCGVVALLLDLTGWFTIVGAVVALIGCGYAAVSPRGRVRKAALSINAVAFAVAVLIYAAWLL